MKDSVSQINQMSSLVVWRQLMMFFIKSESDFTQKWTFCHYLLTLISFLTWLSFFCGKENKNISTVFSVILQTFEECFN